MRLRRSEHDLPDGVEWPDSVAAAIAADERRAAHMRRRGPELGALKPPDARERGRLLAAARRGDGSAIEGLWERYRLRVRTP